MPINCWSNQFDGNRMVVVHNSWCCMWKEGFSVSEIFMQNDCLKMPRFSYFSNWKHHNWMLFGQIMIISFHWLVTNQLWFDSALFIRLKSRHTVKKKTPFTTPSFLFFRKIKYTISNDISYPTKLPSLLQFGPLF